jgi:hypothetical protein
MPGGVGGVASRDAPYPDRRAARGLNVLQNGATTWPQAKEKYLLVARLAADRSFAVRGSWMWLASPSARAGVAPGAANATSRRSIHATPQTGGRNITRGKLDIGAMNSRRFRSPRRRGRAARRQQVTESAPRMPRYRSDEWIWPATSDETRSPSRSQRRKIEPRCRTAQSDESSTPWGPSTPPGMASTNSIEGAAATRGTVLQSLRPGASYFPAQN